VLTLLLTLWPRFYPSPTNTEPLRFSKPVQELCTPTGVQ
jgi:hypothetical protein